MPCAVGVSGEYCIKQVETGKLPVFDLCWPQFCTMLALLGRVRAILSQIYSGLAEFCRHALERKHMIFQREITAQLSRVLVFIGLVLVLPGCANQLAKQAGADGVGGVGQGGPVTPGTPREFAVKVGDIVYFTTDSTSLTPEAKQILVGQARWLNQYPQFTITVEGHADERGTREYNIALGAKRAAATKTFLTSQGVSSARMRTLSYGKERPVAVCNDISCWSQNRRAKTVLNRRAGS